MTNPIPRTGAPWDYIPEPPAEPYTAEQERALVLRFRQAGDQEAATLLLAMHKAFIAKTAKAWNRPGLETAELFQEGVRAWTRCLTEKFDPKRGNKLFTYAAPAVERAIQRVALAYDEESEAVAFSLEDPVSGTEVGSTEALRVEDPHRTDDALLQEDRTAALEAALDSLPYAEDLSLRLRFGLGDQMAPMTQAEIGRRLGVSQPYAGTLVARGLTRLRRDAPELHDFRAD